ncbi:ABC transporter permease [Bdellovibrio sp. HCB337]|uniref:ABC transporter permease n=1 Tax=Bdellovibrio sp. HCB337 TaxID=3394358 RepID=UPI0039A4E138
MNNAALFSQHFGNLQIAGASLLILFAIGISRFFKLNLGKDIFIASIRTTFQLIAVGYILRWLLHVDSLASNLLVLLVMTLVAAQAIHSRLKDKTWKIYFASVAALFGSVWPLGLVSIELFFGGAAFQESLFFIPFIGVLMGNALSSISLSFVGLERARKENLLEIETFKALGATPFEACHRLYNEVLRSALTPIINGMTVVGIVSLPGVMAGQLIGGVDPLIAARFQILVMFLVCFTAMTGSLLAVFINHYFMMPSWLLPKHASLGFNFNAGDRVLLQGPSGVGKSRLLKSLVGLDVSSVRDNLKIQNGLELTPVTENFTQYVPQKAFFVPGTALENLQLPYQFKKHQGEHYNPQFVSQSLSELGMSEDILQKNAMTLSGGEGQIVHLLRSLQLDPHVLFLDEITAALDPQRAQKVEEFLTTWVSAKPQRSLVLISHRAEQAQHFANKVLTLENSQLILK